MKLFILVKAQCLTGGSMSVSKVGKGPMQWQITWWHMQNRINRGEDKIFM